MTRQIKGADWLVQLEGAELTTETASDAEALAKSASDVAITPANLAAIGSTATFAGLVELATDAEAITGTDTARAVTPANIQAKVSSATAKGIVELATNAEAQAGVDTARAITAANMAHVIGATDIISFVGKNNTGACTATGLKVNDIILSITGLASGTAGDQSAKFEAAVTVNDQIQQTDAGNLSANVYMAFVKRLS